MMQSSWLLGVTMDKIATVQDLQHIAIDRELFTVFGEYRMYEVWNIYEMLS